MGIPRISRSEYRFCEILWDNEPISSPELVKLCREKLEWKKSTTYTVIRRLCDRGVVRSEDSIVSAIVSREEAQLAESLSVIDRSFSGSLPGFVATFMRSRDISDEELDELQALIDAQRNVEK